MIALLNSCRVALDRSLPSSREKNRHIFFNSNHSKDRDALTLIFACQSKEESKFESIQVFSMFRKLSPRAVVSLIRRLICWLWTIESKNIESKNGWKWEGGRIFLPSTWLHSVCNNLLLQQRTQMYRWFSTSTVALSKAVALKSKRRFNLYRSLNPRLAYTTTSPTGATA